MVDNKLYDEKSIESLSPLEFTRLRPGVYCGDTSTSTQTLIEIVANAVDEHNLGHGDKIDIVINGDTISVRDYGQGFIPNSFREDGKTILEAAFSVLNTSGKYRDDGVYSGTSLGSFGIGSKITTYLSHWLDVITYRDGKSEFIHFKEGEFACRDSSDYATEPNGTLVKWSPSEEFFADTHVDIPAVRKLFKVITCLCPGLIISLTIDGKKEEFHSSHGLNDLIDEAVGDKELIKNRLTIKFAQDKCKLDLGLTYTSNYSSTIIPYVNTGLTERGPHITQIKSVITREFNKFFKEKRWLKDKEENLSGDDIQEGMYIVFNITAPNVAYDAQVKSTVTRLDMTPYISALASEIQIWLTNNEKEVKMIADKAINARKAREAAKKAREAIREKDQKKREKMLKFDSKLSDCHGTDRKKCEIYITEGDSATGGLQLGRNNEFQAVLPVRGKILNCQKATLAQIQKNQEIMTMIDAFGLTIDVDTMKITYYPENLRYGKIIIMSDADQDGAHIKNLFYTFIWTFCPQLILDGYVYAGVPPLYKLTLAGNKGYKYIKNDADLEQFKKDNPNVKFELGRMKGLGEMDEDEVEETLMDPDKRIIKQITVADVEAANKLFEDLMGTAIIPRKEYIKIHSCEVNI